MLAPVSVDGALERAIWGKVQRFDTLPYEIGKWTELIETRNYISNWLAWTHGIMNLSTWNDDPDTAPEAVILLLRKAADEWADPPF
ncbi:hypothetical protein OV450_6949 [Actinobacteria bacterium OV450]|nr:hypothetical protein OV450_6949 [Actinobacteria bacterium OV450]